MIATRSARRTDLSARALGAALLLGLVGCAAGRETTLMRSSRAREIGALRAERLLQERELAIWEATREESLAATDEARLESVRASSRLRSVRGELRRELGKLVEGERALAAAVARAEEIEAQLKPLRALEQTLKDKDALLTKAQDRVKELAAEVAKATEAAAAQEAQLAQQLAALQARLAALKTAGVTLAEVDAKIAAASKALAPPAAPAAKKKD